MLDLAPRSGAGGPDEADARKLLSRIGELRRHLEAGGGRDRAPALETGILSLEREVLLADRSLRSLQLLIVKRRPAKTGGAQGLDIAIPSNHERDSSLERT